MKTYFFVLLEVILCTAVSSSCVRYLCSGCKYRYNLDCSQVTASEELEDAIPGNYTEIKMKATPVTKLLPNTFGVSRAVKYTVTLNEQLQEVQNGAFGMEYLDITNDISLRMNRIISFPFDYLHQFSSLISLDLFMNDLSAVPLDIEWPETMESLDLSFNKIAYLNMSTFTAAISLTKLRLTANRLTLIPAGIQWPKTLQELYLDFNGLQELHVSSFTTAYGLKTLVLDGNPLTSLSEDILWPPSLEILRMEHTKIYEVKPYTFSTAWNLKLLDMYGNVQLNTLREAAFLTSSSRRPLLILSGSGIWKMERNAFGDQSGGQLYGKIWLGWNNITTFQEDTFRAMLMSAYEQDLITIDVQKNPIQCDCFLKWLYSDALEFGHKFLDQVSGLVCAENNLPLLEQDPSHFQHCS